MATCRFCGQRFENTQAVRAHLRGCAAYKQRPRNGQTSLGSAPSGNASLREDSLRQREPQADANGAFDEVSLLENRLAAERLKLQLRGVETAHEELDERAEAKAKQRERQAEESLRATQLAERERLEAERRNRQVQIERERREKAQRERQEQRRAIIQRVKREATELWWPNVADRTSLKGDVLAEIETALSALAVEELPLDELVLIAQGIRDKRTREAERMEEAANELAARRTRLIQHGTDYADRELVAIEGLSALDKWSIRDRIKSELSGIQGNETTGQIEDLVDDVLEAEGLGLDDDEYGGDDEEDEDEED